VHKVISSRFERRLRKNKGARIAAERGNSGAERRRFPCVCCRDLGGRQQPAEAGIRSALRHKIKVLQDPSFSVRAVDVSAGLGYVGGGHFWAVPVEFLAGANGDIAQ